MRQGFIFIMVFLFLTNYFCSSEIKKEKNANGNWSSLGSGWLLQITDSTAYQLFDVTDISCIANRGGAFSEIENYLSLNRDTLTYQQGIGMTQFIRTTALPKLCSMKKEPQKQKDPFYNFDVFAATVKEHYAFLDLNEINWKELYRKQRAKIKPQTTDVALYQIIEETLELLNDNHAFLEGSKEVHQLLEALEESENIQHDDSLPEYGDFQVAALVVDHHLEEDMTDGSWLINWGKLNNDIGYIHVKSMWLHADLDLPDTLVTELGFVDAYVEIFNQLDPNVYVEKEVSNVSKVMEHVIKDLSMMEIIVIDLRFNGGGQDAVSFEILSHFLEDDVTVARVQHQYGKTKSPIRDVSNQAKEKAFTKPVYVLTSKQTGSAAEFFSLATLAIPNIKRIGTATLGALSSELPKTLPNGWHFSISNELFMDVDGTYYENRGVPSDIFLAYPEDRQTFFRSVVDDLDEDKRNILNAINKAEH